MIVRTYISIQGASFSPAEFQVRAGGNARRRKGPGRPLTDLPLEYWTSSEATGSTTDVDTALLASIAELKPQLEERKDREQLNIMAHVVLEYAEGDDPVGFHAPAELIGALSSIGAALDIDAVQQVASSK